MEVPLTVCETQDSGVPESLARVIYGIESICGCATRNQLIAGLFYVLMQESGYILKQPAESDGAMNKTCKDLEGNEKKTMTFNHQRLLDHAGLVLPLLTTPTGIYKLPLRLVGVEDYNFQLLITPSAEDLIIVNLLVTKEGYNECFSIALRVSTFVPKPKADNIAGKFFDLQTLSVIFKDNIAHKGRSAVLNAEGIVNNSLIGLMDEVKRKIFENLSLQDLLNLSATCHSMLSIKYDVATWKAMLWRDFKYRVSEEEAVSADNLISIYKHQLEAQRIKRLNQNRNVSVLYCNVVRYL